MDATGKSNLNSPELPGALVDRLAHLYPKISPVPTPPLDATVPEFGAPILEMPPIEVLTDRVVQCSFKIFTDPTMFLASERAKSYVCWSSPRSDAYRVYFNSFSKKVYIDVNGPRWEEIQSKLEEEILYCEILRSLIFVLTCEVEVSEAAEAPIEVILT